MPGQEAAIQLTVQEVETKAQDAIEAQINRLKEDEVENKTMQALNNFVYQAEQLKLQKETEEKMENPMIGLRNNDHLKT